MDILHVLVVDDEPGMRSGVRRTLKNFSVSIPEVNGAVRFETDEASSGEEALDKIGSNNINIVLLDFKLPGISGLDVLEKMPRDKEDFLAIMMTAYASIETAVRATRRGAFDFLPKPFTPNELRHAVEKAAKKIVVSYQAKKLAEEKRRVRFQFISVLSHELKAPLAAIESYLQIMQSHKDGLSAEAYAQMVDRCLTRIGYMKKMVFDLLDLTRIESGLKTRELREVDIHEIAVTSIDTVLPEAEPRGIAIRLHGNSPFVFRADPSEIEIILNNLISNAVKYNRDKGTVDVNLALNNDELEIKVSDTGIGMSEDEVNKIFADFVRIRNDKTADILGSGLGLSTVRKLARLYNGDAKVESVPDKGSTFTVTLKHPPKSDTAVITHEDSSNAEF